MNPLLSSISPELADKLKEHGAIHLYGEGQELFAEGDPAEFLPVVISGQVKMIHFLDNAKEVIIGIFGEGEMFAVPPVFDGKSYPSTAISMTETRLLLIERKVFLDLLRKESEFAFAVIGWMTEMLRDKTATIRNLAEASPDHRIANVLLKLVESDAETFPVKITLRREDIGKIAGLTTETTIRAVRRLAQRDLLTIKHGKIYIDDPAKLRRFITH